MKPKLLTTLPDYTKAAFFGDLMAGVTVAMVAVPLSIAIAIASGAAPAKGLVTAIIGGFLVSLLGGSRVQIGGPTGAFVVVVSGVIAAHGYDGLVAATLMAGLILICAGVLRIGTLISYIPEAVVNGFTIGIAIIIATSQIKDFFGLKMPAAPADFMMLIPALWQARATVNLTALMVALLALGLIVLFRRIAPKLPGLIVALAIASAFVGLAALPVDTISARFGPLPTALPVPEMPEFSVARMVALLPSALTIAFLAGVESLLSAMVADKMIDSSHRPNAEVLAQGFANIGSALFGGMPATGAIARTATNVRAGGTTPVAGIVHALGILIMMMLAGSLLGYMAMPALAALLILTAWNMSEPQKWRGYLDAPWEDRLLLLLTLMLTVLANLTIAISLGVALGLALRLRRSNIDTTEWQPPNR